METQGDIAVDGFWKTVMTVVFDVRIEDPNAKTYWQRSPVSIFQQEEWEKVQKYTEPCWAMWRHFTPIMYLVAGVPGKETWAAKKHAALALVAKFNHSIQR